VRQESLLNVQLHETAKVETSATVGKTYQTVQTSAPRPSANVAVDVIVDVVGAVIVAVHVHGNDTVGVIRPVDGTRHGHGSGHR